MPSKGKWYAGCQMIDCKYRKPYSGFCEYFEEHGVTRTFLHRNEPGVDINNPCREFEPGQSPYIRWRKKQRR